VLVREMLALRCTPVTAPRVSAPTGWLRGVRVRLSGSGGRRPWACPRGQPCV